MLSRIHKHPSIVTLAKATARDAFKAAIDFSKEFYESLDVRPEQVSYNLRAKDNVTDWEVILSFAASSSDENRSYKRFSIEEKDGNSKCLRFLIAHHLWGNVACAQFHHSIRSGEHAPKRESDS
jgi:hypothetical protein